MKVAKRFGNVSGKLRTAEDWARIEDERDELERAENIETVEYMGRMVSPDYVEQMIRY